MANPCRACPAGTVLDTLDEWGGAGYHQSLTVQRCNSCRRLWLVRSQWDAGTGSDTFWVAPGETVRGYTFDRKMAAQYRRLAGG